MATMTKTKLQNFIDGEFVDAADALEDYTEIKHVMVNLEA